MLMYIQNMVYLQMYVVLWAKRQAKRDARKANDDIFWNNYNPKLSVKDNLKVLKALGMKISKTKLYELIKKYNNDTEIFEERMANRN